MVAEAISGFSCAPSSEKSLIPSISMPLRSISTGLRICIITVDFLLLGLTLAPYFWTKPDCVLTQGVTHGGGGVVGKATSGVS